MARIQGIAEEKAGWLLRTLNWLVRRRLGRTIEPFAIMGHHPKLLAGSAAMDLALDRSRRLEARLKELAQIKAATLIGCPF